MNTFWIVFLSLYGLNILSLLGLIFFERRSYDSLLVWALVLMFLPGVGLFFYIIFGKGPSIGKKKMFLSKTDSDEEYFKQIELQKKMLASGNGLDDDITRFAYFNLSQCRHTD
jgi:cardiolipin synthase